QTRSQTAAATAVSDRPRQSWSLSIAATRSAVMRKNRPPPPSSTVRMASCTGVMVISAGGGSSSGAACAGAPTTQPPPPGRPPPAGHHALPGRGQFIEHGGLVTGPPAREHERLQRRGGQRRPGELIDRVEDRIRASRAPATRGPPAWAPARVAGGLARVLPGG